MTKYLDKSFTVTPGHSAAYRDNYDLAFGKEPESVAVPLPASSPRLVLIESPYAGELSRNVQYAREAMRDSLLRGEAPYASHLLYAQPGLLNDFIPAERAQGIEAGLAWGRMAAITAVYADNGVSPGMELGIRRAEAEGRPVEIRYLYLFPEVTT